MDPVQILLFATVTILTSLLVAVGVQVFLILRDIQKAVNKFNKLLDDAQVLTHSVARPIEGLRNFIEGVKDIKSISGLISQFVKRENKPTISVEPDLAPSLEEVAFVENALEEEPVSYEERAAILINEGKKHPIHRVQEQGRRFFHRAGKPLTS